MASKVGIGITTYNPHKSLAQCIAAVHRHTAGAFSLVIADDGSTDETARICGDFGVTRISGRNMGIAWNKNRALFFLHQLLECDVLILLEDDCYPTSANWAGDWVAAALKWGHINFRGAWFGDEVIGGAGTVADPFLSRSISGQCTAFSRRAIASCGYLDSRFKGYGYEHAEHSARLVRGGFGGEMRTSKRGELEPHFYLLSAELTVVPNDSYRDEESMAANWQAWERMFGEPAYRYPWRSAAEFKQFRKEIRNTYRNRGSQLIDWWRMRRSWHRLRPLSQ